MATKTKAQLFAERARYREAALGFRSVLKGLSDRCAMDFCEDDAPWCNKAEDKHSIYCPRYTCKLALAASEWLETEGEKSDGRNR